MTEKVRRSTRVPVLTVPPAVERVESVTYQTILCPIEFSDPSIRALEYALTLAEETGARLILLHVIELAVDAAQLRELSHFTVPEYQRYLEEDARARLRSAVPDEARVWRTPEERVMSGKAHRVILDLAEQERAEAIVIGVHGDRLRNHDLSMAIMTFESTRRGRLEEIDIAPTPPGQVLHCGGRHLPRSAVRSAVDEFMRRQQ